MNPEEKAKIFEEYRIDHFTLLKLDGYKLGSKELDSAWTNDPHSEPPKYTGFGNVFAGLFGRIDRLARGKVKPEKRQSYMSETILCAERLHELYDKVIDFRILDPTDSDFSVFYKTKELVGGNESPVLKAIKRIFSLCEESGFTDITNSPEYQDAFGTILKIRECMDEFDEVNFRITGKSR